MTRNVGSADRVARIAIGVVLLGFGLFCPFAHSLGTAVSVGSGVVGAVLVATGFVRFCPAYRLLGMSTCRTAPTSGEST